MKTLLSISIMCAAAFFATPTFAQDLSTVDEVTGLAVGEAYPPFKALTQDETTFDSQKALEENSLLVIFYRGQWCPYCNRHLSAIQDSLDLLKEKGIQVVAISPERPALLREMAEKTDASYPLLYDEDRSITRAFDGLFLPTPVQRVKYNAIGANMKDAHGDETEQLPVPATYLIAQDGKIIWRHFERDYKSRSSVKAILEVFDVDGAP